MEYNCAERHQLIERLRKITLIATILFTMSNEFLIPIKVLLSYMQ